jgi:hypothetical protein
MAKIMPNDPLVGNGPVETERTRERSAVTLGITSDEVHRGGWNKHRRQRLLTNGADLLIPDFSHPDESVAILFLEKESVTCPIAPLN